MKLNVAVPPGATFTVGLAAAGTPKSVGLLSSVMKFGVAGLIPVLGDLVPILWKLPPLNAQGLVPLFLKVTLTLKVLLG